jgi:N-methylhydantoinase B
MVAEEAIKGLESYFRGEYEPGDFIVANDPYIVKGGHLPDWNFVRPAFYKGELIGFLQAKTHVSDTGGFCPNTARGLRYYCGGLNIPPLKVQNQGSPERGLGFLLKM